MTLTEKKITLNKLDSTILEEIQPDRIADEINKTSKFLQELIESLQKLTLHLSRFQDQPTQVGTVNFSLPSENVNNSASPSNIESAVPKMQAKLPKLTLPRYSGEPTKWQQFWDSFESAAHKNSAISKPHYYLKGLSSHQLHVFIAWLNTQLDGAILLLISLLERKY